MRHSIYTISFLSHLTPKVKGQGSHEWESISSKPKKKKPYSALPILPVYQYNPSLSLLLVEPANYGMSRCSIVSKSSSAHFVRHQAAFSLTDRLLNIPSSGSFLSQMDRTLLVYQLFPLTYLFSFVRPAVRFPSSYLNCFCKWLSFSFFHEYFFDATVLCEVLQGATFFLLDQFKINFTVSFLCKRIQHLEFSMVKERVTFLPQWALVSLKALTTTTTKKDTFSLSATCNIHPPAAWEGQAEIFPQQ